MNKILPPAKLARRELQALCDFAALSRVEAGFGYLGEAGEILENFGAQLWINCRMTHMFSLFHMAGINPGTPQAPSSADLAQHGLDALSKYFQDSKNGGWFSYIETTLDPAGNPRPNLDKGPRKESYAHAFVLLAASSALAAGIPGAKQLLDAAWENHNTYWWEESQGRVQESFAPDWSDPEPYRGANANMHTLEALLGVYENTLRVETMKHAVRIATQMVNVEARNHGWRMPEHYSADWQVDPEYNRDKPNDPFRPWGITPGHGFDWARLCLQMAATVRNSNAPELAVLSEELEWVDEAAAGLIAQARQSWDCDGAAGFVYTTDFEGKPLSTQRMHWVVCEALAAQRVMTLRAKELGQDTLAEECEEHMQTLLEYIQRYLIESPGRWHHELDAANQPANQTWAGKADIYHAGQAMFILDMGLTPGFALALSQRRGGKVQL